MEDDIMNQLIMALLVLSAIFFVLGGLSRFLRFQILGHEPTVWWRGSMSSTQKIKERRSWGTSLAMRFKCTLFRLQNKLRSPLDSARITGAESARITEGVICIAHHPFVAATRFLRARRFCSSTTTSLHATYELAFCGATA